MELADNLRCVFSTEIEEQRGSYTIEIPKEEITNGVIHEAAIYRVALLAPPAVAEDHVATEAVTDDDTAGNQEPDSSGPPVERGDIREVEIEDLGEQGDGIARVERGFVTIVPETEQGDRVTIEITNVRDNVAFAEVVENTNPV